MVFFEKASRRDPGRGTENGQPSSFQMFSSSQTSNGGAGMLHRRTAGSMTAVGGAQHGQVDLVGLAHVDGDA